MKVPIAFVLFSACLLLAGCHPDFDGSRTATLQLMEKVDASDIAHEKAGDPPPKGKATWRDHWQSRIVAEQGVEDAGTFGHMGRDNIAFIRRQRAEAGLPPLDPSSSPMATGPTDPLRPVHSAGGRFTVQLPGTCTQVPDKPGRNANILHTYLLVSRLPSTDTLFSAVKFVYRDAAAARIGYERALVAPAGFATVSQTPVKQAGLSGQDIKIRSLKGNGYGYSRVLLGNDAVFLLIVESLPGRDQPIQRPMHAFFDSLVIDPGGL